MPVEIRELVIQAKLNEDVEKEGAFDKDTSTKKQADDCQSNGMSAQEKQDLRDEIMEYLKEYLYHEKLR